MNSRRVLGTLVVLALPLLGAAGSPAHAVTGSPPVTTPDAITLYPGGFVKTNPAANDTDPDGDSVAVCRLGDEHYRGIEVETFKSNVVLFTRPRVQPGVYTYTYQACDFSYLVPGTITVTVTKAPDITVRKVASHPGRIKVTNPADFPIRFLYGSREANRPDGSVRINAHAGKVIDVDRPSIIWVAITLDGTGVIDRGQVSGIRPGRAARPGAPLTAREAYSWLAR